jgi:hypothetical protein
MRQIGDRGDHVGRLVHDDHRRGTQAGFHLLKGVEIHQHGIADRLGQQRHRGAARDHRQQVVPAAAHAAGVGFDQLLERDAHLLFDIARLLDVPGDAEDLGAGVLGPAEAGPPGRATAQNLGCDGDGLDVVDRRGAAVEAHGGGERRLEARLTLLAFQALEQRGLLAADVGAGTAVDVDVVVKAGVAGVLADQPGLVGLVDRLAHALGLAVELAAHVDVAGIGAHRETGHQAALEQAVRVVAQDLPVLAGARFGFVGVDDQIARPAVALLGHERPLEAGREAGAAAPAQFGILDDLHDLVTAQLDHALGAVPDAALERTLQAPVVLAEEIGEDPVRVA